MEIIFKGALRYSGRLAQKPFREIWDHFRDVGFQEYLVASDAKFLASMLDLAYDCYENSNRDYCIDKWDAHGYEIIPSEEFEAEEAQDLLNDRRYIAFALRKKRRNRGARDVLVLIRGTVFTSGCDLIEDFHIVREGLHTTKRVKRTKALVLELVHRYGFENVCLVGHSLGAAVAFLIAREIYLELGKQTVEGHYFNLPFMCLETLLEQILHLSSIEYALFRGTITLLGLESSFNQLKDMVAGGARKLLFLTETAKEAEDEFVELIDWKPNIYVNPCDRVCKSYIKFFEDLNRHSIGKSGMSRGIGLLKGLGFDAKTHHLCPSANLIITNKGISTWKSHLLNTWVDVKARHIRIKSSKWNGKWPLLQLLLEEGIREYSTGLGDGRIQVKPKLGVQQTQLLFDNALRSYLQTRRR